jgi:hypothetical protein
MKKYLQSTLILAFTLFSLFASSQDKPKPSPASTATGKAGNVNITITYSAPSVKGRTIWGALVPFGKVWRTGANDATTFEIDGDVKIEGKTLAKGKYSLFTIPDEGEWTIIINKNAKQWGAFSYKAEDDVLRFKAKSSKSASFNEALKFQVENGNVSILWENLAVSFNVK